MTVSTPVRLVQKTSQRTRTMMMIRTMIPGRTIVVAKGTAFRAAGEIAPSMIIDSVLPHLAGLQPPVLRSGVVANRVDQVDEGTVRRSEETYRMFREGDLEFFDRLDPDVEWHVPDSLPKGGHLRGQSEVIDFLETVNELFDEPYPDPEEFVAAGDRLLIVGTWRAKAKATGEPVAAPFAHVVMFRDGLLCDLHVYIDTATVLQALEPDGT
jgi:uncharacterized protein